MYCMPKSSSIKTLLIWQITVIVTIYSIMKEDNNEHNHWLAV